MRHQLLPFPALELLPKFSPQSVFIGFIMKDQLGKYTGKKITKNLLSFTIQKWLHQIATHFMIQDWLKQAKSLNGAVKLACFFI